MGVAQPVPELADAIHEMRWLLSKNFETETLLSPSRSLVFFEATRFLEANSFARVHSGDVRFARVFCELVGTASKLSPYHGACSFIYSHAWQIALDMVKANEHDASIVLHVCKALLAGLRCRPGMLHAVLEAGAIPILASVVESRAAVTEDGVGHALAAELVELLKSA